MIFQNKTSSLIPIILVKKTTFLLKILKICAMAAKPWLIYTVFTDTNIITISPIDEILSPILGLNRNEKQLNLK